MDVQSGDPNNTEPTDSTFYSYIDSFEDLAKVEASSSPISFGLKDKTKAGVCYKYITNGEVVSKYVKINETEWKRLNENQKYNLIYHELGHCILNREHNDNRQEYCPVSFMNSSIMGEDCLERNWLSYLEELF